MAVKRRERGKGKARDTDGIARFRLAELLAERGLTQTELQHRTRLAYSTINEIVGQRARRVDLATITSICRALGCTPGDLITMDTERG